MRCAGGNADYVAGAEFARFALLNGFAAHLIGRGGARLCDDTAEHQRGGTLFHHNQIRFGLVQFGFPALCSAPERSRVVAPGTQGPARDILRGGFGGQFAGRGFDVGRRPDFDASRRVQSDRNQEQCGCQKLSENNSSGPVQRVVHFTLQHRWPPRRWQRSHTPRSRPQGFPKV